MASRFWNMIKAAITVWIIVIVGFAIVFKSNSYDGFQSYVASIVVINNETNETVAINRTQILDEDLRDRMLKLKRLMKRNPQRYRINRNKANCDHFKLSANITQRKLSFSLSLPSNVSMDSLYYDMTSIPSLVLVAPPKSGTTSFVYTMARYPNIVRYGRQNLYWQEQCVLHDTTDDWKEFLNLYLWNKIKLSFVIHILKFDESKCSIHKYQIDWNSMYRFRAHCYKSSKCRYPDIKNKSINYMIGNNSNGINNYCYLIEKAPCYANSPWIPILYANLLPKIKLLNIIRNPATHIVSATYAFNSKVKENKNVSAAKYGIINKLKSLREFNNMSIECMNINKQWQLLQDKTPRERYLIMKKTIYKQLMVKFLWMKYVSMDINYGKCIGSKESNHIYQWSIFIFPTILTALFAYDESNINGIGDNYRFIQFEYLYSNVATSMKLIYCWLMNINDDLLCDQIINNKENAKLFEDVVVAAHRSPDHNPQNILYEMTMKQLFHSCNKALVNVLVHDRNDLLFGEWL